MRHVGPKTVSCPVHGIIDIRQVLPLIETPHFQALRNKVQLGLSSLVFPSATHTRFAHCVGTYAGAKKRTEQWAAKGVVTKEEAFAVQVYALLHDIGHPAFSHVTEDFCRVDDDERSLELIRGPLRPVIENMDVNFHLLNRMAAHKHPLHLAVKDKNLGVDKLDYLERDGEATILSRPHGIDYVREHVYFVDGQLAIDQKTVEHVLDTQSFYMKMYKQVYLRKALVIAQRAFHKMVAHLIGAGELNPEELMDMTDHELIGRAAASKNPMVMKLYQQYRQRNLFKEAAVIRPENFQDETRIAEKPIYVHGIAEGDMMALAKHPALQKKNHRGLEELEDNIAVQLRLPWGSVLVVPVFDLERFIPKDVMVYGDDGRLHSLEGRRPAHFEGMAETARSYMALRICVHAEFREQVSTPDVARAVCETLELSMT